MADFVSGDTGSTLLVTCEDASGVAINLTGATVKLRWKGLTGTVADKTMTLVTPLSGICSYKFLADELIAPAMEFELEITDSGGYKLSNTDLITVDVRSAFA